MLLSEFVDSDDDDDDDKFLWRLCFDFLETMSKSYCTESRKLSNRTLQSLKAFFIGSHVYKQSVDVIIAWLWIPIDVISSIKGPYVQA